MRRGLHAAVQGALNRALALDPERDEVLAPLYGRRLRLQVDGMPALDVTVAFERGGVELGPGEAAGNLDVTLSGPPSALLGLLAGGEGLPDGLSVRGDLGVLQQVRDVSSRLRPDWPEPIARVLGDELGQPVTAAMKSMASLLAHTARELGADVQEYLREESGLLASAPEVAQFCEHVDELRDAVERIEKRVALLAGGGAASP